MVVRHSLIRLSVCILSAASAWAQVYTISTIAGTATQGYAGDSGPATSAEFFLPGCILVDSSGKIYITDGGNQRVRVISSGTVTTFAGNGTAGFLGDTKAATSAELHDPSGLALDSSGNLYIADASNSVIRVVSGGNINTFAGTATVGYTGDGAAATSAELSNPVAVAVDSSNNVYIADAGNNVIREVSSGNINTILGGAITTTQLSQPDAIVYSNGALYIADTGNRRILKYEISGGAVTLIAGNGTLGYTGDGGPAVDAGLGDPMGLAVDAVGNVYIADTLNSRIRKVTPDGTISTVAGDGIQAFFGDGGVATKAAIYFPHDVALDSAGNIYIADTFNNRIRLLQPEGPAIFTRGVVSSATYKQQTSPGALASVFGTSFGNQNTGTGLPAGTTLGGVAVSVNGKAAPILFITPGQVNFQVPWETAAGNASVTVTVNGKTSNTVSIPVLTASPGLFTVQNSDSSPNSSTNPAKAGSNITAYLTGSGPVTPAVANGVASPKTPATLTSSYSAKLGSTTATVTFAGLAPGFVGLVQMNITVPSTLATGSYPLAVTIAGETSNSVTVSVTQ